MTGHRAVPTLAAMTAAVLALSVSACSPGEDGPSTTYLKVAFNQTESHPQYKALAALGERIEERTDGRYGLEIFPNETLGNQKDSIELVQADVVDLAMVAGSLLENYNPDFVVFNLPYTFDTQEHQRETVNDPEITGELFTSIEDDSIRVLAGFHGGIRSVYSSEGPVTEPADLAGQKIRVIESDTNLRMMELMGGSGTPMGQGDVYTAIQSGVLSGGENNESIYANLKHAEIAPYYSYTRHLMFPDYLVVNPSTMDGLSEEDQKVFAEEIDTALDEEAELWVEEVETSVETAVAAGAEFNEVDTEAFRAALEPLVEEKLTTPVTQEIYAQVRAAAPGEETP